MLRRILVASLLAASLGLPATAAAQEQSLARFVAVSGEGRAAVERPERLSDRTIARAVTEARVAAIPLAIADARVRAQAAATAAGLPLGALLNVDESRYGPYGPYEGNGRFGFGRYCGTVTRRIALPRRAGQRRYRVVRRRQCIVPAQVNVFVAVTFAAG